MPKAPDCGLVSVGVAAQILSQLVLCVQSTSSARSPASRDADLAVSSPEEELIHLAGAPILHEVLCAYRRLPCPYVHSSPVVIYSKYTASDTPPVVAIGSAFSASPGRQRQLH